jgi:hypothetical protein
MQLLTADLKSGSAVQVFLATHLKRVLIGGSLVGLALLVQLLAGKLLTLMVLITK